MLSRKPQVRQAASLQSDTVFPCTDQFLLDCFQCGAAPAFPSFLLPGPAGRGAPLPLLPLPGLAREPRSADKM